MRPLRPFIALLSLLLVLAGCYANDSGYEYDPDRFQSEVEMTELELDRLQREWDDAVREYNREVEQFNRNWGSDGVCWDVPSLPQC